MIVENLKEAKMKIMTAMGWFTGGIIMGLIMAYLTIEYRM